MRTQRKTGAAIVELAVLLPVGVLLLVTGQWMTELLLTKLRLREAARFGAWEFAARPQQDFATGNSGEAFARARDGATQLGDALYADLDSVEANAEPRGLLRDATAASVRIWAVPWSERADPPPRLRPDAGGRSERIAALARVPFSWVRGWGFEHPEIVTSSAVTGFHAPRLGLLPLDERVALIANAWNLTDGRDSEAIGGRTGVTPSGDRTALWRQVDRMHLMGDREPLGPERIAASALTALLPFSPPAVDGTFVVAQALRPDVQVRCPRLPGYPRDATSALRDFADLVEPDATRCFGTQPLRDTQEYAASLPLQAYRARGAHFLGCPNPEADDPSRPVDEDVGDRNVLKQHCGGSR